MFDMYKDLLKRAAAAQDEITTILAASEPEPVPPEESFIAAMAVARAIVLLDRDDLESLLNELDRTESIMPFLDPTGYRRISGTIQPHRAVIRALLTAHDAIVGVLAATPPPMPKAEE